MSKTDLKKKYYTQEENKMSDKKLRVYNYVNFGSGVVHYTKVSNPAEGLAIINALASFQLTLEDSAISSNAFGLEEWDEQEQEWYDWADEEGLQDTDYREGTSVSIGDLKKKYYKHEVK